MSKRCAGLGRYLLEHLQEAGYADGKAGGACQVRASDGHDPQPEWLRKAVLEEGLEWRSSSSSRLHLSECQVLT